VESPRRGIPDFDSGSHSNEGWAGRSPVPFRTFPFRGRCLKYSLFKYRIESFSLGPITKDIVGIPFRYLHGWRQSKGCRDLKLGGEELFPISNGFSRDLLHRKLMVP
jgi:hypothetical protein